VEEGFRVLEFVLVFFLARYVGNLVEVRGHSGTGYRWLTVGLWVGGEILGFVVGINMSRGSDSILAAYPFGIAGALAGFFLALFLARQVPVQPGRSWNPTHVTPPAGLPAWAQPNPAMPPIAMIPGNVALAIESRAGDWAFVRSANGWGGFVDARALVAQSVGPVWAEQPQS
jgi:hypothetical protein